jgi:hypothetical protein
MDLLVFQLCNVFLVCLGVGCPQWLSDSILIFIRIDIYQNCEVIRNQNINK